ncbi:hypothetical protein GQ600_21049 [Phytophthora cactorum]|nr:hypothetical protein GQ600_21049 [Phytophthora cactorum]
MKLPHTVHGSRFARSAIDLLLKKNCQKLQLQMFFFYIGRLPRPLRQLTLPECLVTRLVCMVALTRVVRGGRHRCIQSHCIAFDCTPASPILLLPRSIQEVKSYRVVMVGAFTPIQAEKARKMHRIRNCKVQDVQQPALLKRCAKRLCSTGELHRCTLNQYFVEHVDNPDNVFNVAMEREQENIRGQTEAWRVREEIDEATVLEQRIGQSDDAKPISAHEHPFPGKESVEKERDLRFDHKTSLQIMLLVTFSGAFFLICSRISAATLARSEKCLFPYKNVERQFAEDELLLWSRLTDLRYVICIFIITFVVNDFHTCWMDTKAFPVKS